jgi:hypothetical protein
MRTTLTIADDVIEAAKGLAARDRLTVGEALTELARRGIKPAIEPPRYRNGIRLLPYRAGGKVVTCELVNELRDEME